MPIILDGFNGGDFVTLPDDLQSNWKLDETSGNAIDAVGGFDFTETGTLPSATGIIDGARGPHSGSNYIQRLNDSGTDFEAQKFLIEGWFNTSVTGAVQYLFAHWNGANNGYIARIESADNKLKISYPGVVNDFCVSTNAVTDGDWHYMVYACLDNTGGANNRRLYIDNNNDASATGGGFSLAGPLSLSPVSLGTSGGGGSPLQGLTDDFAYWDLTSTSLTWTDIETIINNRYAGGAGAPYDV